MSTSKTQNGISREVNEIRRQFTYKKKNQSLAFNLRIDDKEQVYDFLELLQAAVEDVSKEINPF